MKIRPHTSIIVPCRNEAGAIESLLASILNSIEPHDEIIVVEGGSFDTTWDVVTNFRKRNPQVITIQQSGKGKFDAVLEGIKISKKDYIMIWDADGTVSFADNMKVLHYHESGPYLLTGDRLKGQREKGAMQFSNFIGNWFFAVVWGLILARKPLDTLCGTKKFPTS
jgi:glycosyltransferase involved in cell wall biosynthesis